MPLLSAQDLVVRFANEPFLKSVALTVDEGERIGLVGRNGAGKTTLLRLLAGITLPEEGEIHRRRNLRIGFLPQDFALDEERSIRDNVLDGAADINAMLAEYDACDHATPQALALADRINHADGWNLGVRMNSLLDALRVPRPQGMPGSLSGGEKRRVALCRALVGNPDLLLLDEPTNHLDTATIEWLETYLTRYVGSLLLVTHDRYFLDRVTNRILEIDHGELFSYAGNYSRYLELKAERETALALQEQRRLSFIRRELDWVRRGPKARGTKSKGRLDRFYAAVDQGALETDRDIDLMLPPPPRLGNRVIELDQVTLAFGDQILFRDLSCEIAAGTCLGIVGPNGCGKTSLLRLIMGQLPPTTGKVQIGDLVQFNYVDQNRDALTMTKTVAEEIGGGNDFVYVGDQKINLWTYLKRFLFEEDRIRMRISELSGGERNRLHLAKQLKIGGNVLILDEPTNDLDLASLRVLEEALAGFGGCLLLVSHDRYFLDRLCTHVLVFDGREPLTVLAGDYSYYRERIAAEEVPPSPPAEAEVKPRVVRQRRLTWKEQQELEGMEDAILTVEEEVARIEGIFSQPDFYTTHGDRARQLQEDLDTARHRVHGLYARWEELTMKESSG